MGEGRKCVGVGVRVVGGWGGVSIVCVCVCVCWGEGVVRETGEGNIM